MTGRNASLSYVFVSYVRINLLGHELPMSKKPTAALWTRRSSPQLELLYSNGPLSSTLWSGSRWRRSARESIRRGLQASMGRRLRGRLSVEGGQDYPKPSGREPTSLVGQADESLCDIIILIWRACFVTCWMLKTTLQVKVEWRVRRYCMSRMKALTPRLISGIGDLRVDKRLLTTHGPIMLQTWVDGIPRLRLSWEEYSTEDMRWYLIRVDALWEYEYESSPARREMKSASW